MSTVYTNDLRLKEIGTGLESGTWGTSTNTNLSLIAEAFSYQTEATFSSDANVTATIADGSTDKYRAMYVKVTSGTSLSATRTLTIGPNTCSKAIIIENATSGAQIITVKQGSGATVNVPNGKTKFLFLEGTGASAAVIDALDKIDLGSSSTLNNSALTSAASTTTFTNKTFDADGTGNSLTNVEDANIKSAAAIDASKIANGNVSNAEFQYLDGVTSAIQTQIDTKTTLAAVYPVGSIYINATNSTNPASLLGFGTWAAFGAGRVMVGLNSSDSDFDTAEETGGSKTHTLSTSELPSHTHGGIFPSGASGSFSQAFDVDNPGTGADLGSEKTTAATGGGGAHNNLQPYIVVYMWKRTAQRLIMEILLWIIFVTVVGKALLKAVAPYKNRALDEKLREYWDNLRDYF